jgi:hypothetical protein
VTSAPTQWRVQSGRFSELVAFSSAQRSLLLLLEIASDFRGSVQRWEYVLVCLCTLRDHVLLPADLVLDPDADLLPPNVRADFDCTLQQLDRSQLQQPVTTSRKQKEEKAGYRASFLSLVMLGEALFGPDPSRTDAEEEENEVYRLLVERYNKRNSRWDAGYDLAATQADLSMHAHATNTTKRLVWDEALR